MSIIGKLTKKVSKNETKAPKKEQSVVREKKSKKSEVVQDDTLNKQIATHAGRVIISPYITEKTSRSAEKNTYVFIVARETTKNEIIKAIQSMFKVHVTKVNVLNMPGKKVRMGRYEGRTPGFKKAMITIKEGEKIDIGI